jgi:hypothetical protein
MTNPAAVRTPVRDAIYGPQLPGSAAYTTRATSDTLSSAFPFPRQATVIAERYGPAVLSGGTLDDPSFVHAARSSAVPYDVCCSSDSRLRHCPQVGGVFEFHGSADATTAAGSTNAEPARTAESGRWEACRCGAFAPEAEVFGCGAAETEAEAEGTALGGAAEADADGLDSADACGAGCRITYAAAPPADPRTRTASRASRRVGMCVIDHP